MKYEASIVTDRTAINNSSAFQKYDRYEAAFQELPLMVVSLISKSAVPIILSASHQAWGLRQKLQREQLT